MREEENVSPAEVILEKIACGRFFYGNPGFVQDVLLTKA